MKMRMKEITQSEYDILYKQNVGTLVRHAVVEIVNGQKQTRYRYLCSQES